MDNADRSSGSSDASAPWAGDGNGGPQPAPSEQSYKVVTFNAGLAVGVVKYASERAPLVTQAIASADADLVCLQEVWLDDHWNELVRATRSRFPHAMRLQPTLTALHPTCTQAELAPLRACVKASCARMAADQLAACVIQSCASVAEQISIDCVNCVTQNPTGTLESIAAACVEPSKPPSATVAPKQGMVAYGGSYGLGLLTHSTVVEQDSRAFPSALNPRGVLYAKLHAMGGELHVFCTHLTPDIAGVPRPGGGSWRRDHAAEVDALLLFIQEKTGGAGATLLLGDLNAGPALRAAIAPRLTDDYHKLAASFTNAYASGGAARCTYCNANPLVGGAGAGGSLIDHVLVRGVTWPVEVDRSFDEPLEVSVSGGARRLTYSDHFGLRAVFMPTLPPSSAPH